MTAPEATTGQACPWLGLHDDPATHFLFPSHAQRCHATARPSSIEIAKQARDCLTAAHVGCSRYRPPVAPVPHGAVRSAIHEAELDGLRPAIRPQVSRTVGLLVIAVLFALAAVGGVLIGQLVGVGTDRPGASGQQAGSGASASVASLPTPTPTPPPSAAPTPTAAASASASPSASPSPSPEPTPLVHRIRPGETLTAIAKRYGVTIAALKRANGIEDPNLIVAGQVLVIPRP